MSDEIELPVPRASGPKRPPKRTAEELETIADEGPAPSSEPSKGGPTRPARASGQTTREEFVYDATGERIVIGAAISADRMKRAAIVRSLAPDEMLVTEHSPIWRALRVMVDQGLEYDPATMRRLVADEGGVDHGYLEGLEADASIPANLDFFIETVRFDATRARTLKGPLPEMLRALKDPKASPDAVQGAARALLRAVEGGGGRKYMHRGEELSRSYKAELRTRKRDGNFWSFGWDAVDDRLVEGAMPKRTAVFAGLPGSGKSTFAANWLIKLAAAGRRPLMGCWEMPADSMLDVLVSAMAGVELERIVQGRYDDQEELRIERCIDWITERIRFMDNAFMERRPDGKGWRKSNDASLDILEGYIAEAGCDVVFMDLWERCLVDLSYDGVTQALYRQQEIHKKYNVFGVIFQQLRLKDVEKRIDKRPTREAIKGVGAFVEVADLIFGIHRDAQFKQVEDDSIELINLKQRKGKANWAIRFEWNGALSRVRGGIEVPYDPGLESSSAFGGDIGDIKVGPKKPGRASRS